MSGYGRYDGVIILDNASLEIIKLHHPVLAEAGDYRPGIFYY